MVDLGSWAEWVGGIATAVSVIVAIFVFRATALQTQRESSLNWKPHLTFDHNSIQNDGVWEIGASNIGKGPALECRYVAYVDGQFYRARAFAIGAENALRGKRSAVVLADPIDEAAIRFCRRALTGLLDGEAARTWEVLLCSDIFGNRWRFVRGRPYPDGPKPFQEDASDWWGKWRTQKANGAWVQRAREVDRMALPGSAYAKR